MRRTAGVAFSLLAVCCMVCIFLFSAQPVGDTLRLSGNISDSIAAFLQWTPQQADAFAKGLGVAGFDRLVRKCAHLFLYFILAFILVGTVRLFKLRKSICILVALAISILFACGDELHQGFVPGRTSCFMDVCIDTCGAVIGAALACLAWLLYTLCKRGKRKRKYIFGGILLDNKFAAASEMTADSFVGEQASMRPSMYTVVKRLLDVLVAVFAVIVFSPIFLLIAVAIKLDSKGSVIYMQRRVGKNGRPFMMYKFRSMCANAEQMLPELKNLNERDGPAFKIANDPRVTRVGKIIRKTCLDEMPQLINIIKGEMSFVGPRPPLPNEVAEYTPYQMKRLGVTPGLTCYWQISERKNVTFEQWVELDLKYIRNRSLWVDLMIVLRTIPVALLGKGMY